MGLSMLRSMCLRNYLPQWTRSAQTGFPPLLLESSSITSHVSLLNQIPRRCIISNGSLFGGIHHFLYLYMTNNGSMALEL